MRTKRHIPELLEFITTVVQKFRKWEDTMKTTDHIFLHFTQNFVCRIPEIIFIEFPEGPDVKLKITGRKKVLDKAKYSQTKKNM